jgi:hypothetical protein
MIGIEQYRKILEYKALGLAQTKTAKALGCFLQALFPESCKPFFHSIASPFSTKLQVPFPHRN